MFRKIFGGPEKSEKAPEADERPLAVAALMVEAARADERYDVREAAIIDRSLASLYDLSAEQAAELRGRAEDKQRDALDIQRFTRIAKEMATEEKISLVEILWEIVLSDGERDPFEDALIRRVCGLIYLDDPQSGAARARVEERLKDA